MTDYSVKFHKDVTSSFWVFLLTDRQTDRHTYTQTHTETDRRRWKHNLYIYSKMCLKDSWWQFPIVNSSAYFLFLSCEKHIRNIYYTSLLYSHSPYQRREAVFYKPRYMFCLYNDIIDKTIWTDFDEISLGGTAFLAANEYLSVCEWSCQRRLPLWSHPRNALCRLCDGMVPSTFGWKYGMVPS